VEKKGIGYIYDSLRALCMYSDGEQMCIEIDHFVGTMLANKIINFNINLLNHLRNVTI
jgi:hypothetical protein